jgi:hypothetical protein
MNTLHNLFKLFILKSISIFKLLGSVVQTWINSWVKFHLLFEIMYFRTSVYFKTSEKKPLTDTDKIFEEIFPNL